MERGVKRRFWLIFCIGFLLLAILWYSFTFYGFGTSFPQMMNAFCYLLPVNILLTLCFFAYGIGGLVCWRRKTGKLPKSACAVCGIAAGLSLLYPILATPILGESTTTQQRAFIENLSLKNLVASEYEGESFWPQRAQRWGDTAYVCGEVRENAERMAASDAPIRAQLSAVPGAIGEAEYIQNVPKSLQAHVQTLLEARLDDRYFVFSWFDEDLVQTMEYDGVQFIVYYDAGVDFSEKRMAFMAQYEDDYLLFTLRFEDGENGMHMEKETVMQKTAEFMKQGA